ncbi:hypothetical protein [Bradyrhizobium hipponense]|uniref:hypothetical protein n=1 Tax=Bradyrhizobium hipponense TaxID=2605638 RepID=UPI001F2347D6|nr:hypothetical protein [Bradyrhizobium hipponense]
MRVVIGRCAPHELVGDLHGSGIVRELEIDVDRAVQRGDRRARIHDELVEPVSGLSPVAELVQHEREIVDAFLVARLALQLFQSQPDKWVARGCDGQDADPLID